MSRILRLGVEMECSFGLTVAGVRSRSHSPLLYGKGFARIVARTLEPRMGRHRHSRGRRMSLTELIKSLFASPAHAPVPPRPRTARHHVVSNPWHAVSIVPNPHSCAKARGLAPARFLSKEAPHLPLEGCDARVCDCHYRHHQDRRREPRRASDVMASGRSWNGAERRRKAGRRGTDVAWPGAALR